MYSKQPHERLLSNPKPSLVAGDRDDKECPFSAVCRAPSQAVAGAYFPVIPCVSRNVAGGRLVRERLRIAIISRGSRFGAGRRPTFSREAPSTEDWGSRGRRRA